MVEEQFKAARVDISREKGQRIEFVEPSRYQLAIPPLEQEIVKIAKDLMEQHYTLDAKKLYHQSVKRLPGHPTAEISSSISSLLKKKVLFDGKALTRDDVFTNETRAKIFEIICYRPGIYISAIRTSVGKDSRSVLFHLSVLKRFGFVRYKQINNNKAYYETTLSEEFDVLDYFFQRDGGKEIFKTVIENASLSFDELRSLLSSSIPAATLVNLVRILFLNDLLSGRQRFGKITAINVPARFRSRIKHLCALSMHTGKFHA